MPRTLLIYTRAYVFVIIMLLLAFGPAASYAQTTHTRPGAHRHTGAQPSSAAALVGARYAARLDSLKQAYAFSPSASLPTDTLLSPYFSPLLGAPMLWTETLEAGFGLSTDADSSALPSSAEAYALVNAARVRSLEAYTDAPWLARVDAGQSDAPAVPPVTAPFATDEVRKKDVLLSREEEAPVAQQKGDGLPWGDEAFDIVVRRPNFWKFKTNFSLQFTQNYVSDNWYKGGESNIALLAATILEANYDNQQKFTSDNKLEMKLGFQSSSSDKKRKYKANSDLIRLTNKLALKAVKDWNYALMLQTWTQFYRGYKSNDDKVYSDFLSPLESLLSLGMDYKKTTKNNKFTVSATLAPLALKFKYVQRPSLVTSYGIDEGKHVKWEYGSNVTVNYTWKLHKNISWTGRVYFFTDYHSSQIEWENTFNLAITKYLSTKLFLYPRFDDSRSRAEGVSNFEFKELLSLGLNVNF